MNLEVDCSSEIDVGSFDYSKSDQLQDDNDRANDHQILVVTHQLSWFAFLERIVRLAVFKYAVLPFSTCYQRFFLRRFQNHFAGYGYCGYKSYFDETRAQSMINTLREFGGEVRWIIPKDGEARLQMVHLTVSSLRKKIESLGGSWEKQGGDIAIRPPKKLTPEWNQFYCDHLKRVFPIKKIDEEGESLVTAVGAEKIPFNENIKPECILFSSFAGPMVMKKHELAFFLGQGMDICIYDGRGLFNSQGYATEEGRYNDIDAVADELLNHYRGPEAITIYGSCGESFPATYLFKKYHAEGINLIFVNAPLSLERALERTNKVAFWIFKFFKNIIRAPLRSNCRHVPGDGFDTYKKLTELSNYREGKYGYALLINTEGDEMAPPEEVEEMGKMLGEKGNFVVVLQNHSEDCPVRRGLENDAHLSDPLKNPYLKSKIIETLYT